MATMSEVEQALAVIAHAFNAAAEPADIADVWRGWSDPAWRASLQGRVTLLHCTSQYPTPMQECNLRAMDTLRAFGLPVGYSDHTEGILIPLAAVARGATLIEKHFTLDRAMSGRRFPHLTDALSIGLRGSEMPVGQLGHGMSDGVVDGTLSGFAAVNVRNRHACKDGSLSGCKQLVAVAEQHQHVWLETNQRSRDTRQDLRRGPRQAFRIVSSHTHFDTCVNQETIPRNLLPRSAVSLRQMRARCDHL
jgi:hypothetical protein